MVLYSVTWDSLKTTSIVKNKMCLFSNAKCIDIRYCHGQKRGRMLFAAYFVWKIKQNLVFQQHKSKYYDVTRLKIQYNPHVWFTGKWAMRNVKIPSLTDISKLLPVKNAFQFIEILGKSQENIITRYSLAVI